MRIRVSFVILLMAAAMLHAGAALADSLSEGKDAFGRRDWLRAQKILGPLADRGDRTAQYYLGYMYLMGFGVSQNIPTGIDWLTKSAESGQASSQYILGRVYLGQWGLSPDWPPPDHATGLQWLLKAAANGSEEVATEAQLELGRLYEHGGLPSPGSGEVYPPRDETIAYAWFAKAAMGLEQASARGDLDSQMKLAGIYDRGEGVPRDSQRALKIYQAVAANYLSAAERGDAKAQTVLARMYARGLAGPRDPIAAAIWNRRAADQGDHAAQLALANFYQGARDYGCALNSAPFPAPYDEDEVEGYVWMKRALAGLPANFKADLADMMRSMDSRLSAAQRERVASLVDHWAPVKETPAKDGLVKETKAQRAEAARITAERRRNLRLIAAGNASAVAHLLSVLEAARRTNPRARGFSMRAVDGDAGPGAMAPSPIDNRLPQIDGGALWLKPEVVIDRSMIADAHPERDFNDCAVVAFRMTDEGARRFAAFTAANVGRQFAIVWDGVVVSAPRINDAITGGSGEIAGDFNPGIAEELALAMLSRGP